MRLLVSFLILLTASQASQACGNGYNPFAQQRFYVPQQQFVQPQVGYGCSQQFVQPQVGYVPQQQFVQPVYNRSLNLNFGVNRGFRSQPVIIRRGLFGRRRIIFR